MRLATGPILPRLETVDPVRAWRWVSALTAAAFGVLGLMVVYLVLTAPDLLWIPPVLLAAGLLASYLVRSELGILAALLVGFTTIVGYKAGFQLEEIVFGIAFLGYLGYWFASRLFFYRDDVLATRVDRALFGFLAWATLSFGLTFLFRGEPRTMLSEWSSVVMLAIYFPLKEVGKRDERTVPVVVALFFGLAAFVALRNLVEYGTGLGLAEALWQIAAKRVVQNEHLLLMASLGALVVVLYSNHRTVQLAGTVVFVLYLSGVVIGQSRALWVSFVLGWMVIFLLSDRSRKIRLVWMGVIGVGTSAAVAALLFPDFFSLIVGGLLDRFLTLETAAVKDISLIGRFVEMGAVWPAIKANPVLGYGFGVSYEYFSLVYQWTHVTSFVHNGPIGVLYKHGLIGFCLLYFFYVASLVRGVRLARHSEGIDRMIGIAVTACLMAEALVGNTENPFATSDKTLLIGLVAGMAAIGTDRLGTAREETAGT